jgi:hypothetical protein
MPIRGGLALIGSIEFMAAGDRISIRHWTPDDGARVETIHAEAFGEHGAVVVPLLRSLQTLPASAAKLALVAAA